MEEEILKNTRWNRMFHKNTLIEQNKLYNKYKKMVGFSREILDEVKNSSSLYELLDIHKKAWEIGFRNMNLGPCEYGMFRTKDILYMNPSEVFLGGIYGLNTRTIFYWEQHSSDPIGPNGFGLDEKITIYSLILDQYRKHLFSNFLILTHVPKDYIFWYEEVNPVDYERILN